ncbi:MAG: hypothetical protein CR991_02785 [Proteobacteria bacterium]|nr:MAG: hypothetical protein CR991_02785 [Pseudomonadota bacterium]
MQKIMEQLHQDHVNLARLLNLLKQQLAILESGEEADLFLIIDIADYIRRYSDQVHHPREDQVYRVFSQCNPEATAMVAQLLEEHEILPGITQTFHDMLSSVINAETIVSRQELQDKISHFIDIQTAHMDREENTVFPLIHKTLQASDWQQLSDLTQDMEDPLFGRRVLDRYQNLYEQLAA